MTYDISPAPGRPEALEDYLDCCCRRRARTVLLVGAVLAGVNVGAAGVVYLVGSHVWAKWLLEQIVGLAFLVVGLSIWQRSFWRVTDLYRDLDEREAHVQWWEAQHS